MRISDWSSDVCSSDLVDFGAGRVDALRRRSGAAGDQADILRLESGAAPLDPAQRLFAVGDLRVEEVQALARVAPAAAKLVVAEPGNQAVEQDRKSGV